MRKKIDKEKKDDINEEDREIADESELKAADDIEEEIQDKKKKVIAKGVPKKEAENIIGEIEPPENLEDKEEVKKYLKDITTKLDQLLSKNKEDESEDGKDDSEENPEETVKIPWYDRNFI